MKLDNKLNEVERQKRARLSRSRWKKLSRKSIFLRGKRSTKNLVRLCEENASEKLIQSPKEEYTKQLVTAASPGWLSSLGENFEKKEEYNDQ